MASAKAAKRQAENPEKRFKTRENVKDPAGDFKLYNRYTGSWGVICNPKSKLNRGLDVLIR